MIAAYLALAVLGAALGRFARKDESIPVRQFGFILYVIAFMFATITLNLILGALG